ncbi:50S ribosomal protein L20 [Candidatus Curtissbacteria bacterium RIFCSPLOWO2_01_FULL_41_18]|uniref:Large ribosomal subunit protein bL20 n=2 Tax=Candidatus Curtissiibacteriota TaxID=1752717 RepID=A0A1F5G2J8_9BACT|nr:MAG: 50S ribosomal protein L20 [Candidatus Curtissbacteria bacterium RIFCSPHIGHO2_01_FULL_41_13]OGE04004.1 MAG: 50S ribosomal protein L20 [Candidatus Curtissbacteria bacterium RIFCSPLOWO2_01_FULL_41_18]
MRVKRGLAAHKRHKKILKLAKGYRGGRSKLIRQAKTAVIHAGADAYRGRKEKKRQARSLWIIRINAALSKSDISYNQFIAKLKAKNIELDRKILAQIALEDPEAFDDLVKKVTLKS